MTLRLFSSAPRLIAATLIIISTLGVANAEEAPVKTKEEIARERRNKREAAALLKILEKQQRREMDARKRKEAQRLRIEQEKAREAEEGITQKIISQEDAIQAAAGVKLPEDMKLAYAWSVDLTQKVDVDQVWAIGNLILFVGDKTDLYCARKINGVFLWAIDLDGEIQSTPTVTKDYIYVFVNNKLVAIDRFRGEIIYDLNLDFIFSSRPATRENRLYIPSSNDKLVAGYISSEETPLFSRNENNLIIRDYEFNELWANTANSEISGYPVISDESIFVALAEGYAYSIDLDGQARFKAQTQGSIWAPIAVGPENVYVSADDFNVYSFGKLTGEAKWIFPTNSRVVYPVVPDRSFVFISTLDNGVFCIKETTGVGAGDMLWHIADARYIAGISESYIYLALRSNRLAAVEKRSGHVMWISLADTCNIVPHTIVPEIKSDLFRLLYIEGEKLVCLRERDEILRKSIRQRAK